MHGIVFSELQKFVVSRHAHAGWKAVTEKAGLAHKVYLAAGQYPDSDIVSLVTAASAITGQEPFKIVEAFGEFIAPSLLKIRHGANPKPPLLPLIQPALYAGVRAGQVAPGFRDITSGGNGAYSAGPGWDACTGLGVPDGTALLDVLSSAPPPA